MGTGHDMLDAELPNKGWPRSSLVELLVEQHGIGEIQLLKPCLRSLSQKQRVAFVQPPYLPHSMTCRAWHLNERNLLWLRPQSSADALWSAEQILKNGSIGGLVIWQANVRPESLRRLNLAAQSADTWLWLVRPIAAAADASAAPLRIALRPAVGGVFADIIKRKGPTCDAPIFVPLPDMPVPHLPILENETATNRAPAAITNRVHTPAMV
jgi:protein ImuA